MCPLTVRFVVFGGTRRGTVETNSRERTLPQTPEDHTVGKLYDIIDNHRDQAGYRISQRQVARRLDVSPTTLKNWQTPRELIAKHHLEAIAGLTGVPYQRVLDALLDDIGYLHGSAEKPPQERRPG